MIIRPERMMKSSVYNLVVPGENGNSLLFNTLTKSFLVVDKELRTGLEENSFGGMDPGMISGLHELGIIVDDEADESKVYALKHNLHKYSTDTSSFLIFPTHSCNLRCPYCYETVMDIPKSKSMDRETIARTKAFIKGMTLQNRSSRVVLGFYGGEPLLRSDICLDIMEDIFNWAGERGISYFCVLTTNGTLLSPSVSKRMHPFLSSVHFTLDGPAEKHNAKRFYMDNSGTYYDVLDAVSRAKDKKIIITVRINLDDDASEEDVSEILADLEERGFKDRPGFFIYFAHVTAPNTCFNEYHDDSRETEITDMIEKTTRYWGLANSLGWGGSLTNRSGEEHGYISGSPVPCEYIRNGCYVVDPLADIYLCPAYCGMKEYSAGAIDENGMPEWNSSYFRTIENNPVSSVRCKKCNILPVCNGGCPFEFLRGDEEAMENYCRYMKKKIEKKIVSHFRYHYPEKYREVFS
ncbi:radical SAM/SPASM domain-containing protein [Methanolacinia petrolearia]|nr:radical SAM protein [Methanolacinia petrolearia]